MACLLYELLAGQAPFHGPTPQATLMLRFTATPRPLRPLVQVSEALEAAIFKALARNPEDRFPTAAAFSRALAGEPPAPAKPRRAGCLGVVVLALALLMAYLVALPAGPALASQPPTDFDIGPPSEPAESARSPWPSR